MTTKIIKQLEEFFNLSTTPVLNQINQLKEFINESSANFEQEEAKFWDETLRGLENQYEVEKQNPLAEVLYKELSDVMADKDITKLMNVLMSDNHKLLFDVVDRVLHQHYDQVTGVLSSENDKIIH